MVVSIGSYHSLVYRSDVVIVISGIAPPSLIFSTPPPSSPLPLSSSLLLLPLLSLFLPLYLPLSQLASIPDLEGVQSTSQYEPPAAVASAGSTTAPSSSSNAPPSSSTTGPPPPSQQPPPPSGTAANEPLPPPQPDPGIVAVLFQIRRFMLHLYRSSCTYL